MLIQILKGNELDDHSFNDLKKQLDLHGHELELKSTDPTQNGYMTFCANTSEDISQIKEKLTKLGLISLTLNF